MVTENWLALLPAAPEVVRVLELTKYQVPLCFDFGNWSGPQKYDWLSTIAPHAVTCHAKCAFAAREQPDRADFNRCLKILEANKFAGTISLIYDGPDADEWHHLELEAELVREVFPGV